MAETDIDVSGAVGVLVDDAVAGWVDRDVCGTEPVGCM